MKWLMLLLLLAAWTMIAMALSAEEGGQERRAGWPGVFPDMAGYQRTFLAPVVAAGQKPAVYRQTARYEWTGGAIKLLEATVARDPAFKQKHAGDTVRKEKPPPREVQVGKRKAWLWELGGEEGLGFDKVVARMVVPLGDDKALILEAKGAGPWEPLADLAGRFDLDKIEAALAQPPRTD